MVKIRTVTRQDSSEIARILQEAAAASIIPIGPHWSNEQISNECEPGDGRLGFVATSDSAVIDAFVLFRDTGAAWEISFLATSAASRRKGHMASLLAHLIALKPSDRELWLEVHEANDIARRLYRKHGFKEVGKRPRYYSDGGAAVLYNYG